MPRRFAIAAAAMADQIGRAELAQLSSALRGGIRVTPLNGAPDLAAQLGGLTAPAQRIARDFVTGNLVLRSGDRRVPMPLNQRPLELHRPS